MALPVPVQPGFGKNEDKANFLTVAEALTFGLEERLEPVGTAWSAWPWVRSRGPGSCGKTSQSRP